MALFLPVTTHLGVNQTPEQALPRANPNPLFKLYSNKVSRFKPEQRTYGFDVHAKLICEMHRGWTVQGVPTLSEYPFKVDDAGLTWLLDINESDDEETFLPLPDLDFSEEKGNRISADCAFHIGLALDDLGRGFTVMIPTSEKKKRYARLFREAASALLEHEDQDIHFITEGDADKVTYRLALV
jgi:hypothetical protein